MYFIKSTSLLYHKQDNYSITYIQIDTKKEEIINKIGV